MVCLYMQVTQVCLARSHALGCEVWLLKEGYAKTSLSHVCCFWECYRSLSAVATSLVHTHAVMDDVTTLRLYAVHSSLLHMPSVRRLNMCMHSLYVYPCPTTVMPYINIIRALVMLRKDVYIQPQTGEP